MARIPYEDLKVMVLQLKVSDLLNLLQFAGQNKTGRKQDLQTRALNLLKYNSNLPLEMRVRRMYLDTMNNKQQPVDDKSASPLFRNNPLFTNGSCYANGSAVSYDFLPQIPAMSASFGDNSLDFNFQPNQTYPAQPNIVLKHLPFDNFISEIVRPTTLVDLIRGFDLKSDFVLRFKLTHVQSNRIMSSKTVKNGKTIYGVQLHLRISRLDSTVEEGFVEENPISLEVLVNGKPCSLPPPIPSTNRPGVKLRRMNFPTNITPQCSINGNSWNNILINWDYEAGKRYAATVHLVKKVTHENLINNLKIRGFGSKEQTLKLIKEKLSGEGEDDIAAMNLRISLACPLGKMRMNLPARAKTCNHLQCFDASLYIQLNEAKPVWLCPVCNKSCLYDDLFIDRYFCDVLSSDKFTTISDDILIEINGSWSQVIPPKKIKNESIDRASKHVNTDSTSLSLVNNESVVQSSQTISNSDKFDFSEATSYASPPPSTASELDLESTFPDFLQSSSSSTLENDLAPPGVLTPPVLHPDTSDSSTYTSSASSCSSSSFSSTSSEGCDRSSMLNYLKKRKGKNIESLLKDQMRRKKKAKRDGKVKKGPPLLIDLTSDDDGEIQEIARVYSKPLPLPPKTESSIITPSEAKPALFTIDSSPVSDSISVSPYNTMDPLTYFPHHYNNENDDDDYAAAFMGTDSIDKTDEHDDKAGLERDILDFLDNGGIFHTTRSNTPPLINLGDSD